MNSVNLGPIKIEYNTVEIKRFSLGIAASAVSAAATYVFYNESENEFAYTPASLGAKILFPASTVGFLYGSLSKINKLVRVQLQ
ncbi:MAG: hypothetical protein Tsb0021_09330 [Chlamydiales bacterium]